MSITKKSGRQEVISARADFTFADLTSATAVPAIDLPAKARILSAYLKIGTAWNSATSDGVVVQSNESTPKAYVTISAASGALSAGLTTVAASTNLAFVNPVASTLDVKWTGAGTAPTTGTATLIVEYVVDDRAAFSQG